MVYSINSLSLESDAQALNFVDLNTTPATIGKTLPWTESSKSFEALDFTELAKKVRACTVKVQGTLEEGTIYDDTLLDNNSRPGVHGTGFFISEDGHLVTNYHVIKGLKKIEVVYTEAKKTFQATCIGSDPELDIAVLKINSEESLPYLLFAEKCTTGQKAMLAGYPSDFSNIITSGYIASECYNIYAGPNPFKNVGYLNEYVLYDGTAYKGNSGGALVDECGNILGVHSRGSTEFPLGCAGKGTHVKKSVEEILEKGFVSRASLGFRAKNLTPVLCSAYDTQSGVIVRDINPESIAYELGIRFGDIIVSCDEKPIFDFNSWIQDLALHYSPGQTVHLQVIKGNEKIDISLQLDERKVNQPTQVDTLGASFVNIDSEVEMSLGYDATKKGALIWTLESEGILSSLGFIPGDVITGIILKDGYRVPCETVEDLLDLLESMTDEPSFWFECSDRHCNQSQYIFVKK